MDQRFHVWRGVPHLQANAALYLLSFLSVVLSLPPTKPPLIDSHPFMVIWNVPTSECKRRGIPLDTTAFQAVTTPASVSGQFLTLFYVDRLGLYPHIDPLTHMQFNGGIPQKGDLSANLLKAYNDISHYMPLESAEGLAVIDWEAWRPIWEMDGDSKDVYRKMSISNAQEEFPSLTPQQVPSVAKRQFEEAARSYMEETIVLGINKRPNQQWGFYLFPDCYNYGWEVPGYSGKCTEKTKSRNDQLLWLWESSTALYPSIYLPLALSDSHNVALFVRNRVQEAVRVAALPKHPYNVPIYVYSRPLYKDQNTQFLSQEDLVRSIGETAALGASGSVLWGASSDYNNLVTCKALSKYLTTTLNPYIANVTAAAKLCSDVLCQGNGRCVRKNYDANDYLHLNQDHFEILQSEGYYLAVGLPSSADLKYLMDKFTCQCYAGRKRTWLEVLERAALGASGSVLWRASSDYDDQVPCKALSKYLTTTLNPYIANVTAAAKLCSDVLCQGNGRCVRKNYDSNDYLHLNQDHFEILQSEGHYLAVGLPSSADLKYLMDKFTCQCYVDRSCSPKLSYPTNTMLIRV